MRKLSLMLIAMLILVAMVFAMTQGSALGQDEDCKDGVIDAKAGGVVAKSPCDPVSKKIDKPGGGKATKKEI